MWLTTIVYIFVSNFFIVSIASKFDFTCRMIPDYTVNKGTSKCHKTDEKRTHFSVHVPPSLIGVFNYPTTPTTISKMQWSISFNIFQI